MAQAAVSENAPQSTHAHSGHLDHGGEARHERRTILGLLASFGAVFGWIGGLIAGWSAVTAVGAMMYTPPAILLPLFGWAAAGSGIGAIIGLVLATVVLSVEALVRRGAH